VSRLRAGAPGVIIIGLLGPAFVAAANEREVIGTYRPGVVVGADTLPRGVWQVEAGVDYARQSNAAGRTRRASGVVTMNFGLLEGGELLLESEPAGQTTLWGRGPDYLLRAGFSTKLGR
jgi:hypothetical protein